jgi:hypothetical protein
VTARATYVLPLKWTDDGGVDELTAYLERLAPLVDLIVVDGSQESLFVEHHRRWHHLGRHIRPDPGRSTLNGKVGGVLTGAAAATTDIVIVADDDVRYDAAAIAAVASVLADADLVVPQNYFDPSPWHARWDTGRTLLNRAVTHDYPGTLAVRVGYLRGGYDGDVLFENLELIRTVRLRGGRVVNAPSLFVRRLPPDSRLFWAQRRRQAYDDWAQPWRFLWTLPLVPTVVVLALRRRFGLILTGAAAVVGVAEVGRRRHRGTEVFAATAPLWAPVWALERAACSWLAVWDRLVGGGVRYRGGRLPRAATPLRELRARVA